MEKEKICDVYGTDKLEDFISVLYTQFAEGRKPYEETWRECWWNYVGQYNPEKKAQTTEGGPGRSRLFVRVTTQKIRAAHAKIMESIGLEIPFKIIPLNDTAYTEYISQGIADSQKDIIRNQFKKIGLRDRFDTEILLMCVYGTGILKGPVISTQTVPSVEENVENVMGMKVPMWKIPFKNYPRWKRTFIKEYSKEVYPVSIWDFFTDCNADSATESIGNIERKYYSPYEFQERFFNNDNYDKEAVIQAFNSATETYDTDKLEITRGDNYMAHQAPKDKKIAVLEYWGQAPYGMLKEYLKDETEDTEYKDTDIVECCVILSGIDDDTNHLHDAKILKAKLNPSGNRIFKVCPFVKVPGSPYGIGVAESIKDSQSIINSMSRLLIDNKVLSGNGMFAIQKDQIDTRATKNGLQVHPGKVFFTKGDVNMAIKPLVFPDITAGIDAVLDRFERWADEESGIPKYSQGEQSSFLNKTATGMSMIMNQSNIYLKTTIRNIDEFFIKPIAQDFNSLNEIDGSYPTEINIPMDVVAMGVDSLMAKEIKFENAMKLFQVANETGMSPYLKKTTALRIVSELLDVKDLVVNEIEAQQVDMQLQQEAAMQSQVKLSANVDAQLLSMLSSQERVQLISKLGIQGDINANRELLIKKAQELELDTQAKIMVNDRKELGKAQGNAANNILESMIEKEETTATGRPKEPNRAQMVE